MHTNNVGAWTCPLALALLEATWQSHGPKPGGRAKGQGPRAKKGWTAKPTARARAWDQGQARPNAKDQSQWPGPIAKCQKPLARTKDGAKGQIINDRMKQNMRLHCKGIFNRKLLHEKKILGYTRWYSIISYGHWSWFWSTIARVHTYNWISTTPVQIPPLSYIYISIF